MTKNCPETVTSRPPGRNVIKKKMVIMGTQDVSIIDDDNHSRSKFVLTDMIDWEFGIRKRI